MSDGSKTGADIGWGVGGALLLHVAMIFAAVAWVAFYSYVVEPGHERAFYESYAQRSGPVVSLISGGPVFYLFASWLSRRRGGGRAAWIAAILYLVIDAAIFAGMGSLDAIVGVVFLGGAAMKLAGTALGVMRAKK